MHLNTKGRAANTQRGGLRTAPTISSTNWCKVRTAPLVELYDIIVNNVQDICKIPRNTSVIYNIGRVFKMNSSGDSN